MSSEPHPSSEEVLWSGACSHWYYFWHWLLGLLVVTASAAAIVLYRDALAPYLPWLYAVPVVLLLIVILYIWWVRGMRRYQVTRGRVVVTTGRVVTDSNEIRVQDIRSINVDKNGLAGFFGIGDVEFSSAATDDAEVTFVGIAGADGVRDLVRKLQS